MVKAERRSAAAARPEAHHQPRVGVGAQRHRPGDAGEDDSDQLGPAEHVEHDLLDRVDEGEQRPHQHGQRDRIADRLPDADGVQIASLIFATDSGRRSPRQSLGQPKEDPQRERGHRHRGR
jgi:hypothetical protein